MNLDRERLSEDIQLDEKKLYDIADTVLRDFYEDMPEFSLIFVEPEEIRNLNKTYRDVDAVTDVLSFESDGEIDPETGTEYLGDILICAKQAEQQAQLFGHPFENEAALLEIHGLLHLLGYDHMNDEERKEMWALQNEYLDKCGVVLNRRPGEDFDF